MRVEPSPIDVPANLQRSQLRDAFGIGNERLVVIVSRLIPAKRVDVALQAAALLPNTRVVVCGDGPEYRQLKKHYPTATFCGHLPRGDVLNGLRQATLSYLHPDKKALPLSFAKPECTCSYDGRRRPGDRTHRSVHALR